MERKIYESNTLQNYLSQGKIISNVNMSKSTAEMLFPTFDGAKLARMYRQKNRKSLYHSICGECGECTGKGRGKQRGIIAVSAATWVLFSEHP